MMLAMVAGVGSGVDTEELSRAIDNELSMNKIDCINKGLTKMLALLAELLSFSIGFGNPASKPTTPTNDPNLLYLQHFRGDKAWNMRQQVCQHEPTHANKLEGSAA